MLAARTVKALFITALVGLGMAGPAGTASAATPSPWYQTGWNQSGAGFNPAEQALTSANAARLHRSWSKQTPDPCCMGPATTGVVSVAGTAYFAGGDNSVYAVNAVTGRVRWQQESPGCLIGSAGPAVHLGVLLVPSQACSPDDFYSWLTAYDAVTGTFLWSYRSALHMGSPLTVNGFAYVESGTDYSTPPRLDAIDVRTGLSRWHKSLVNGYEDLAADATHLYLSSTSSLRALDLRTGAARWSRSVPGGQVLTSGEHVVVGGAAGGQQAIAAYSSAGVRQWAVRRAGSTSYQLSATASELVVAGGDGQVRALTLAAGRVTWSATLAGAVTAQAAIAGGVVYVPVGTDRTASVVALRDGTGRKLWSYTYTQPSSSAPFVVESTAPSVAAGTLFVSFGFSGVEQAFRVR